MTPRLRPALAALVLACSLPGVASAQKKIVIDPGHGGTDPGAVGNGMEEQAINVDVGLKFKKLLEDDTADAGGGGAWVALITRTADTSVSLASRANYANAQDADRFMSIHANSAGVTNATGTETFSYTNAGESAALRNLVQAEMIAAWGLANRGNKTANFYVLRETAMPAELHELGFINNLAGDADPDKLASPEERQKAAVAHLKAIQRHFDIPVYIPGGGAEEGDVGQVAGVVRDAAGPIAGAQVSLDSGQEVTTPSDGTFSFTGVPVGTRGLTVSAEGHHETVISVEVSAGERADADVVLEVAGAGGGDAGIGGSATEDPGNIVAGCGCESGGGGGAGMAFLALGLAIVVLRRRR